MAIKYHQISMHETFDECRDLLIDDAPSFFLLLDQYITLEDFIPPALYNAFYKRRDRHLVYPLTGFLSALILQKIFSIPSDSLLIIFLSLCKEFRDFCGFARYLMPRFLLDSDRIFYLSFNSSSSKWWISPIRFARPLMHPFPKCWSLIRRGLSFM